MSLAIIKQSMHAQESHKSAGDSSGSQAMASQGYGTPNTGNQGYNTPNTGINANANAGYGDLSGYGGGGGSGGSNAGYNSQAGYGGQSGAGAGGAGGSGNYGQVRALCWDGGLHPTFGCIIMRGSAEGVVILG